MPKAFIDEIIFNDGSKIALSENQITVFVGPNNAGKSVTLKEIYNRIVFPSSENTITRSINIVKVGASADVYSYVSKNFKKSKNNPDYFEITDGATVHPSHIHIHWENGTNMNSLSRLFVKILTTHDRLTVSAPPNQISFLYELPKHPIHHLYVDEEFEKVFSNYFKQAFGVDLTVNKGAGSTIPLHVGVAPALNEGQHPLSTEYLQRLYKLPTLEEQGDGMRSFVGVLLSTFVGKQNMLIIDEPEAFLHPPQAYLLGKMLANELPSDKQLFLSTHSEDFLKGLIDKHTDRVKIIRIQRDGSTNRISELNSNDMKSLWSDPLLKHSNILSGLFHSKVIICESDGDCRFFQAVIDAITNDSGKTRPDVLFIHCGGKHRIKVAINALVQIGVTVLAVTDFDVLNNKDTFKDIYEGLNGDWTDVEADWKVVVNSINSKAVQTNANIIKAAIEAILLDIPTNEFPSKKADEIRDVLKRTNPWSEAKNSGKSYVPRGGPSSSLTELLAKCRAKGLHILEVGEIEGFDRSISDHGPKWVNQVLEKGGLKDNPDFEEARKFVRQLLEQ